MVIPKRIGKRNNFQPNNIQGITRDCDWFISVQVVPNVVVVQLQTNQIRAQATDCFKTKQTWRPR